MQKVLLAKKAAMKGPGVIVIEEKPDMCREQEENEKPLSRLPL